MAGYAPAAPFNFTEKGHTMNNKLQIFENKQFGQVRTIDEDGKILFCAKDVAAALGYTNPSKAINDHCKGIVERRTNDSLGRQQNMKFIPEGDIYRLAAKSELPGADKFESWIFDEVLPSIRKHGAYMTPETLEAAILNPDTMIQLCTALKEEQDKRQRPRIIPRPHHWYKIRQGCSRVHHRVNVRLKYDNRRAVQCLQWYGGKCRRVQRALLETGRDQAAALSI